MEILLEILAIIAVDFLLFLMIAGLGESTARELPRRLTKSGGMTSISDQRRIGLGRREPKT